MGYAAAARGYCRAEPAKKDQVELGGDIWVGAPVGFFIFYFLFFQGRETVTYCLLQVPQLDFFYGFLILTVYTAQQQPISQSSKHFSKPASILI